MESKVDKYNAHAAAKSDKKPQGGLCPSCRAIFTAKRHDKEIRRYPVGAMPAIASLSAPTGQVIRDVEVAARDGCILCEHRWNQLTTKDKTTLEGSMERIRYAFWNPEQLGLTFEYYLSSDLKTPAVSQGVACMKTSEAALYLQDELAPGTNYSGDDETLKIVRWWTQDCVDNHKLCRKWRQCTLPTRLVDVGTDVSPKPKVCESKDLPSDTKYITLSHCWGNSKFETLTRDNYERMVVEIPLNAMTKTFQEAFDICRRLGFQYIWIDSLCIVQGDADDWFRESRTMDRVYQNSIVNIAAAKGPSGQYGCYTKRTATLVQPCKLTAKWNDTNVEEDYVFCAFGIWDRGVDGLHLKTRAWITQETILSPRVVYFGAEQVFWECQERQACETFARFIPRRANSRLSTTWPVYEPEKGVIEHLRARDLYTLWDRIVLQYSSTELTYPVRDRMIALSGIARSIGINDTYLAGLWGNDLPRQLLWKCTGRRWAPPGYVAPTWSWMRLFGEVQPRSSQNSLTYISELRNNLERPKEEELIKIIKTNTTPVDPLNEFGAIKPMLCQIYLFGPLFATDIEIVDHKYGRMSQARCEISFDFPLEAKHPKLFCLPILRGFVENARLHGLLIQRAGEERGVFFRRGYFRALKGVDARGFDHLIERATTGLHHDGLVEDDYRDVLVDPGTNFRTFKIVLI